MSKKRSKQSSNLEEKIINTKDDDNLEENITKKMITSSKTVVTSKATPIETKESVKEPVKMNLKDLKNLKNLKKKQEKILMTIDNENIQKHVQSLIEKFNPPNCSNCPKRRADRVCINKDCGMDKFMQLICGKCHQENHQKNINKPEVDIEEFFIKLATFINEQKYDEKLNQNEKIDIDNLETAFDSIDNLRQKLNSLRAKLESEIEGYITAQEMHGLFLNSIMKALSLCEYDNIQEQLVNIKKCIIFNKNKFSWNDSSQKFCQYQNIFKDLQKNEDEVDKKISKSIIGGQEIDLSEITFKVSTSLKFSSTIDTFKEEKGQIKLFNSGLNTSYCQYYMDYQFDRKKKYKLRFKIESTPKSYLMIGIMPFSLVQTQWVFSGQGQNFCKRFSCSSPETECSRILKGKDLSTIIQQGWQIEMRIDFENNYMDFYDYPNANNINANHEKHKFLDQNYVFAIMFYSDHTVVIERFEEIYEITQMV